MEYLFQDIHRLPEWNLFMGYSPLVEKALVLSKNVQFNPRRDKDTWKASVMWF